MQVGIIVLNWNGLDDTRDCLKSLERQQYQAATVYLVDNASVDGSGAVLAAEFPYCRYIGNKTNQGFTGGNNTAIEHCLADGVDAVLLLNNDTIVAEDFLTHLVDALQTEANIGMVGPKILYFDPPDEIWFGGGTINFNQAAPFRHRGEGSRDQGHLDRAEETEFLTGCCLLVRSEVIRHIGALDPALGYYCEDVEWCLRAKRAGWRIWYAPKSRIWHRISRSTARAATPVYYYSNRNPVIVATKYLRFSSALKVRWSSFLRALSHPVGGHESKALYYALALDILRGRTGLVDAPESETVPRALDKMRQVYLKTIWRINGRFFTRSPRNH